MLPRVFLYAISGLILSYWHSNRRTCAIALVRFSYVTMNLPCFELFHWLEYSFHTDTAGSHWFKSNLLERNALLGRDELSTHPLLEANP